MRKNLRVMVFFIISFILNSCVSSMPKDMKQVGVLHPQGKIGILVTQGDEMLAYDKTVGLGFASNIYLVPAPGLNKKIEKSLEASLHKAGITNTQIIPITRVDSKRFFIRSKSNTTYIKQTLKEIIKENNLKSLVVVSRKNFGNLEYKTDTGPIPLLKMNSEKNYAAGVVIVKEAPFLTPHIYGRISFVASNYFVDSQGKMEYSGFTRISYGDKIGEPQELWKEKSAPSPSEVILIINRLKPLLDKSFENISQKLKLQ